MQTQFALDSSKDNIINMKLWYCQGCWISVTAATEFETKLCQCCCCVEVWMTSTGNKHTHPRRLRLAMLTYIKARFSWGRKRALKGKVLALKGRVHQTLPSSAPAVSHYPLQCRAPGKCSVRRAEPLMTWAGIHNDEKRNLSRREKDLESLLMRKRFKGLRESLLVRKGIPADEKGNLH